MKLNYRYRLRPKAVSKPEPVARESNLNYSGVICTESYKSRTRAIA